MQGYNVLYPMGFDSFGLPAENAAIQRGINPAWTSSNVQEMITQLKRLGLSYDWNRTLSTFEKDYYHWNQCCSNALRKGLVYRKKGWVNWDPVDQTVLANEQVINGKGWRSGADVEKKEIDQWYLNITAYADELLTDLETLNEWPERVKIMQRNWIGKSTGTTIKFDILDKEGAVIHCVDVFTTRPDTLYVTYLSIACEHSLTAELALYADNKPEITQFIQDTLSTNMVDRSDETKSKTGKWLGVYARNPMNEDIIPLYVADYVLMDYGTGVVMAVPAHDQRDFEFAKAHDLPIKVVITPESEKLDATSLIDAYVSSGNLVNSDQFTGIDNELAKNKLPII